MAATIKSYRLHGRFFLFTWSQVPVPGDSTSSSILEELKGTITGFAAVVFVSIGQEHHADGGLHYHAAVEFDAELDRKLDDQLNFYGRRPNAKNKGRKKQWTDAIAYTQKEGDFIIDGTTSVTASVAFELLENARSASSFAEFVKLCFTHRVPFPYCQATWNFVQAEFITIVDGDECAGDITHDQLRNRVWQTDMDRVLCIVGPTGVGKTTWARRNIPKPALFVSHLDDLKFFNAGFHKGIIFDDVSFKHLPNTTQIAITDWDNPRSIHCRHTCARLPKHVSKIFTCNDDPLDFLDAAISRRVTQVYLD